MIYVECRKVFDGANMTADELRKKDRKEMAKEDTQPVKVGRFNVTSHAQNQMVLRDLTANCVIENLCRKPAAKSPVVPGKLGPSYLRINKDTTTAINPINKNVNTVRRTNTDEAKKYGVKKSPHLERESERVARLAKESLTKKKTCRSAPIVRSKSKSVTARKTTKVVRKKR